MKISPISQQSFLNEMPKLVNIKVRFKSFGPKRM